MNRLCRRSTAVVAVFAAVVSLGAASARAQVLQQVPSDALVVIKVNNLKAVSDKVAKFADALGLAALSPEMADPLGSLQTQMNLKEGLDTAGEMAIVFTREAFSKESPDAGLLVLVPVSDYKAFLKNFGDIAADGAVSSFKPAGGGPEMSSASWGKYAAIAQHKELLSKAHGGLKLSGLAAKEAKEKDAFVFANIPALAEMALPEIEKARGQALEEIDRELNKDENAKQFAGVAKAAFGQVLKIAEGFMRDSTAASLSLHLNDDGLATTVMAEFKPGSYGGNVATKLKPSEQPLTSGLPARKYFAVGGMVNAPEVASMLIGDALDPIAKELATTDAGKSIADAIVSLKRSAGATKSVSFGYPVPTGAPGTESVIQSVMVARGDSKTIHEAQTKTMKALGDMMKLAPKKDGAAPEVGLKLTPGGKTVGGIKLDAYKFDMAMGANNPQGAQAEAMMKFIYGEDGMGGLFGPVNKDTFLVVQGGTDKLNEEAVAAAQKSGDPVAQIESVKMVTGQLPAKHLAVEYVFLDNIINTGVQYAQAKGLPIKMQLPPNLPPIGISAAAEGTALRFDTFLPTQTVQGVVAAGMQAFMQGQGGGAGGADGL